MLYFNDFDNGCEKGKLWMNGFVIMEYLSYNFVIGVDNIR